MAYIYVELIFQGNGDDQDRVLGLLENAICDGQHPDNECPMIHMYSTSRNTEEAAWELSK